MCGLDVTEPIVVHIRRQDGAAEEYVVCSADCDQRLWEREHGGLTYYVAVVRPHMVNIDIPLDDAQWGDTL